MQLLEYSVHYPVKKLNMRENLFRFAKTAYERFNEPTAFKYGAAAVIGSILFKEVPNALRALRGKSPDSLKKQYLRGFLGLLGGFAVAALYLNRDLFTQTPSNQGAAAF